ncbi:MAG: hypothetical protein J7K11_01835 [Candidatus Hydrothermae bacterium]|nr:hypothetical protein [Candidatus Hydrothermae bacterium]
MELEGYLPALHAVTEVLELSLDLDQIIYSTLTAITAGESFGFNRAFFLLVEPRRGKLTGYFAMGPANREEAARVWDELGKRGETVDDLIRKYSPSLFDREKEKFGAKLKLLTFDVDELKEQSSPLTISIEGKRAVLVRGALSRDDVHPRLKEVLGVDEFAVVPLVNPKREVGVIIVDNFITGDEIKDEDIIALETFARGASLAISRALLVRKLEEKVQKLEESQARIREYQKAAIEMEKMATRGELMHHLIHELKNPLVVIGGIVNALLDDFSEGSPQLPYMKAVAEEVRKLEGLLKEVVNGIRNQSPADVTSVDLNSLIMNKVDELKSYFNARSVRCRLELDGALPHLTLSPTQLKCVLDYLIGNAVEAMEGGGKLEIKTGIEDEEAVICIRDSGPGIPPEIRERIFEPFFSTKGEGTGLGLYNALQIVRSMGGTIEVESEIERGTLFKIKLPLDQGV